MRKDPMERILEIALDKAGIIHLPSVYNLDFYIPSWHIHIEVKRFHSDRIAEQMSRTPNVIVLQGEVAVTQFAILLGGLNA